MVRRPLIRLAPHSTPGCTTDPKRNCDRPRHLTKMPGASAVTGNERQRDTAVRLLCSGPRRAAACLKSFIAWLYLHYLWPLAVAVVNDVARLEAAKSCPVARR